MNVPKLGAVLLIGYMLSAALAQGSLYTSSPPKSLFFQGVISYPADDDLVLQYLIRNDGPNPIINDAEQIAILYAAEALPIEIIRVPPPGMINLLAPGESEYGTIIVSEAPFDSDNLEFYWRLTEVGPNTRYALTRRFSEMDEQSSISPPLRVSWAAGDIGGDDTAAQ